MMSLLHYLTTFSRQRMNEKFEEGRQNIIQWIEKKEAPFRSFRGFEPNLFVLCRWFRMQCERRGDLLDSLSSFTVRTTR